MHIYKMFLISLLIPVAIASMERAPLTPEQQKLFDDIQWGNEAGVDKYIANKGDLNIIKYANRLTPLLAAMYAGNFTIALKLLNAGADYSIRAYGGYNPLSQAVFFYRPMYKAVIIDLITKLLDRGADINITDDIEGNTPLHNAAEITAPEIADLLIKRGANIGARNKANKTPLAISEERLEQKPDDKNTQEVYNLLKNALIERQKKYVKEQQELLRQRGHQP